MKRKDARLAGLVKYEPDETCVTCGGKLRYVSTGGCVHCLKTRRAELPDPRKLQDAVTLPDNRKDALRLGTKYFMPKTRCQHGHRSRRRTRDGTCLKCRAGNAADNAAKLAVIGRVMLKMKVLAVLAPQVEAFYQALEANYELLQPKVKPPVLPPIHSETRYIDPTN